MGKGAVPGGPPPERSLSSLFKRDSERRTKVDTKRVFFKLSPRLSRLWGKLGGVERASQGY